MRYALAFLAAFALLAGVAAFLRVRGGAPAAENTPHVSEPEPPHSEPNDGKTGHEHADDKPESEPATPVPEGVTDLKNGRDPVTGAAISDAAAFTETWKGFLVHFADAASRDRHRQDPIRYSAKLDLAMEGPDDVKQVDPSTFRMSVLPDECPFCGQELDPEGDVYILHRGFKIYFGCWMGCPTEFLKNPGEYYEDYGLAEHDGKLMLKSEIED